MRVIEAGNVETAASGFAFNLYQLNGSDLVAVVRRVCARVAGADGSFNHPCPGVVTLRGEPAKQRAAALVGIGLFPVRTDCFVDGARQV